jgi:hypothetical protein
MAITTNVATILTGDCSMQHTRCRKKIVDSLVALATVLVMHSLLPQVVQAQFFVPEEQDVIWKVPELPEDDFRGAYYIDDNRILVVNSDKAEIWSAEDGSLLKSASSSHLGGFSPNKLRTKFASFVRDTVYIWDIETLTIETTIPITSSDVFKVTISESGKYIGVMGSAGLSGTSIEYTIWNSETKEQTCHSVEIL